jgi:hypothetical protein
MKRLLPPAVCCVLAVGCMGINTRPKEPAPASAQLYTVTPTAEQLVQYLNTNAAKVSSLESHELGLDITAQGHTFGVRGELYCQKSRNFRLLAKMPALGKRVADLGSNDQEFWYWISEDNPPDLYHCSYADLSRGDVRLPLPLHPDWMLEALGLGAPAPIGTPEEEQAKHRTIEVRKSPDNRYLRLYERTTSLQGQSITKITELNNFEAKGTQPQVVGYYLYYTGQDKPVCYAHVTKSQYDARSQAIVPQRIEFTWPAMNMSLVMTLGDIAVNNPKLASNPDLFRRRPISGARDVDLARMPPVMTPTGIQRAGATR